MAEGPGAGAGARPVFGNRFLEDPSQVYEHNAWDSVEWGAEQEREAGERVHDNSAEQLPAARCRLADHQAGHHWDMFYRQHQNRFFKDRHWLFTEFPELRGPSTERGGGSKFTVFEVGCGAGNTVFPILQTNNSPDLFVYCCDFSSEAVELVKGHSLCDPSRCHPFECDITATDSALPFPSASVDVAILVFVLSALEPSKMPAVVQRVSECLKPGGLLLFRDYGRYDLAQLRFKKGQCLGENFYLRGDGTRVFFFTEDEVSGLLSGAGLHQEQLLVDRRLQVNRSRQLKMYRVWIQAKFRKPRS